MSNMGAAWGSRTAPLPRDIFGSVPATSFTLLTFRVLCSATVSTVSSMVLSSVSKTILDGISLPGWNPSAETQQLIHGHADGKERVRMRESCCSRTPHRNRTDRNPCEIIHYKEETDGLKRLPRAPTIRNK